MNKLSTNYILDMSSACVGYRSNNIHCSSKKAHQMWPGIILLKYGMWSPLKEGQYLVLQTFLMYVLFCTIICIIFTSLCKNFVKIT